MLEIIIIFCIFAISALLIAGPTGPNIRAGKMFDDAEREWNIIKNKYNL